MRITPTPDLAHNLIYHDEEARDRARRGHHERAAFHRRKLIAAAALWRLESGRYDLTFTECVADARRWLDDNPNEEADRR